MLLLEHVKTSRPRQVMSEVSHRRLRSMTPTLSLEEKDPQDAILGDGFFKAGDALLGQRIKEIDDDDVHFASKRGLQFCKDNVFDHPVSARTHLHVGYANPYSASGPSSTPHLRGRPGASTGLLGLAPWSTRSTAPPNPCNPTWTFFWLCSGVGDLEFSSGPDHSATGWLLSQRQILC